MLRWLVDVQCCPVHLTSTANKGKKSYEEDVLPTLQTSKGRSVMHIAMETKHVGILRYLVKERGVSIHEVKDLTLVLGALESMIMAFPDEIEDEPAEKEVEIRKDETRQNRSKKIQSPAKQLGSRRHSVEGISPKPQNLQHPYSVVDYSPKDKALLPRDIHPSKSSGLYGAVGRDIDDYNKYVHANADSDDDGSVCTTMNEMVSACSRVFSIAVTFHLTLHSSLKHTVRHLQRGANRLCRYPLRAPSLLPEMQ